MRIVMLAGEASGDMLGAELIKALRRINPSIQFEGVGGPLMQAEGFNSLLPIEGFSVMGITEIVKSLPRLLRYRKKLINHYQHVLPDAFVGIDYPEFNLNLQRYFKAQGIYTVQYVSPSVWAWREERVLHMKKSTDLVLTLFGFEKQVYDKYGLQAVHCGHPLVDMIGENNGRRAARKSLSLPFRETVKCLAILPGSRHGEVKRMLPIYLQIMKKLVLKVPEIQFLLPAATPSLKTFLESWLGDRAPELNYRIILKNSRMVMQAADAVLLTSGTATLEAMLLEKPMLVSYKVSRLTAHMAKKRLKINHFSLPNLLADHPVVPEYIQDDIDTKEMADKLYLMLNETPYRETMIQRLKAQRKKLKNNAADNAAKALYNNLIYREIMPD